MFCGGSRLGSLASCEPQNETDVRSLALAFLRHGSVTEALNEKKIQANVKHFTKRICSGKQGK